MKFRGKKDASGSLVSASADGPDVFEATITSKPYGMCYALSFDDGSPVGLPFHDFQLEVM